jgi:ABC-type Fe3+-hydroxamate transport system substrate-binding protein
VAPAPAPSGVPQRIVSLIPSITETLFALGCGDRMVGCTIFCTHPPDGVARLTRVGGEKDPKLDVIRALAPDLVVANVEENVRGDVEAMRAWGIDVHVIYPRTVAAAIQMIRELGARTGTAAAAAALADELEARRAALAAARAGRPAVRVFCPIWRRPYMTVSADTYVHDVLACCGGENVFGAASSRYPEVTLEEVAAAGPEAILLPDEPYRFRAPHLADFAPFPALRDRPVHFVDGKLLSWYGPRLGEALRVLPALLGAAG